MISTFDQNQIPGVTVKKITLANENDLDALTISPSTKIKLRDSIHAGHLIYVPSQPFTYQSWTGLVYIDLDPDTGFGGYIIGEGLNGGFTACALPGQGQNKNGQVCEFPQDLVSFFRQVSAVISSRSAVILTPTSGQIFTQGDKISLKVGYSFNFLSFNFIWNEETIFDTTTWAPGNYSLVSRYETNASVNIAIVKLQVPTTGIKSGKVAMYSDMTSATVANMRNLPATSAELIKSIINNENLVIIEEYIEGQYVPGLTNVWHKVSHNNVSGFIISSFVELTGQERNSIKLSVAQSAANLTVDNNESLALAFCESRFKPYARSSVAAKGIYQLMPSTIADINTRLGGNVTNPYNPNQNIDGGLRYFKWFRDKYAAGPSALEKTIAAWNWGLAYTPIEGPLPDLPLETQNLISCVTSYNN